MAGPLRRLTVVSSIDARQVQCGRLVFVIRLVTKTFPLLLPLRWTASAP